MKKTFLGMLLLAVVGMSFTVSCGKSLPQKIDDFVDNASLKSANYTKEDWDKSKERFEELIEKYKAKENSFTKEEKQMVSRAIGRYQALLIKQGVKDAEDFINDLRESLPSLLEEFGNELKDIFSSDGND